MAKNKKKKKDRGASLTMNMKDRIEVRTSSYYDRNVIMVASHGRYATTAISSSCGKNAWILFDPDMDDNDTVTSHIEIKCDHNDMLEWEIIRTGDLDIFIERSVSCAVEYDSLDPVGDAIGLSLEDRIKKLNDPKVTAKGFHPGFCYLRPKSNGVWRIIASTKNDPGEVVSGIVAGLSSVLTRPTIEYVNPIRSDKKGLMFSPMYFGSHPNECVRVDINMITIDEMNLISDIMKRTGIDTTKAVKAFLHQFGLRAKIIKKKEDSSFKRGLNHYYGNPFSDYDIDPDDEPF